MLDLKSEYLYMKSDIDAAIAACLEHQQWILGPEVREFEEKIAEYIGVKHCIGTSSGTDALVLVLRALAIKTKGEEYFNRNDLIITTPFTFTATGDAILRAGATPLFVDIDPATYNIDLKQIRSCLESFPHGLSPIAHCPFRILGILPVHLYGRSCQMDEIMSIAHEYGLFVVEDCAQAFGTEWQKANGERQKVGSIGTAGCLSFFPSKNLGGFGDAGAITTNDNKLVGLIRMLIKHGGKDKYNVAHIGYNARLDTLHAAILLAKLKYVDEFNIRRQYIVQLYTEGLKDIPGIVLPLASCLSPIPNNSSHVFHQFTLRILNGKRDALQRYLKGSGIDSMIYYPVPLHKMKVFSGRCVLYGGQLVSSEIVVEEVLSLPVEPLYSEDLIIEVVKAIREYYIN